MRTEVRSKGLSINEETREATLRRIDFALGRFSASIRRVDVQLSNDNAVASIRCQMTIRFVGGGEIFIADSDQRLPACIHRASERAARNVVKQLKRRAVPRFAWRPLTV